MYQPSLVRLVLDLDMFSKLDAEIMGSWWMSVVSQTISSNPETDAAPKGECPPWHRAKSPGWHWSHRLFGWDLRGDSKQGDFWGPTKIFPPKKTPRLCADLFQQRATAMARISGSYQGREVACWWSKNVAWEEDGRTACWGRICCEYSKRPKRLGWCFANCINFAFRVKLEDCRLVAMINWLFQKTPLPVNTHGSVWGMLPDNVTLGIPGITRSWSASKPPLWRPCAKVI